MLIAANRENRMHTLVKPPGFHPTAWKFRHCSAPDGDGVRRLKWMSGLGPNGHDFGDRGPLETDPVFARLFDEANPLFNNLCDEGEADFVDVYFDTQAVRSALYIRGYNDTLIEAETQATAQNEQSGSGYSALTYTRNTDWTASGSVATGATKTWTATGAWIAMTDIMLATTATGTAGLAIAYVALSATRTLANTETLDVTPTVTMA